MNQNDTQLPRAPSDDATVWTVDGSQLRLSDQNNLSKSQDLNIYHRISRKRLESYLTLTILLIAILLLALCITTYLVVETTLLSTKTCNSKQCIRTAAALLQSVNETADPCDNFFRYACGNWWREHPGREPYWSNTWFSDRSEILKRDVIEYLWRPDSDDEPKSVHQARKVYFACNDFESMEESGMDAFWSLLDKVGLPRNPFDSNDTSSSPWIESMARMKRYLSIDVLLSTSVMASITNSTNNQLAIATSYEAITLPGWGWESSLANTELKKSLASDDENDFKLKIWQKYAGRIVAYVIEETNGTVNLDEIASSIHSVLDIYRNISEMETSQNVSGSILNEIPDEMSIAELQGILDEASDGQSKLQMEQFFETLYEDVPYVTFNGSDEKILVYKIPYYTMLSEYLDTVDDNEIRFLLWWNVVFNLASHIKEDLRDLKDTFLEKMVDDFPKETRASVCMRTVYTLMQPAVGYFMLKKIEKTKITQAEMMVTNIRKAFSEVIYTLTWMDKETKIATLDKLRSMNIFVGYPKWMDNKTEFELIYSNLTIQNNTHLENILTLLDVQGAETWQSVVLHNNHSTAEFDILDINAYYDPSSNAITVPYGILQFPFQDLGLQVLNYGALGTILGHEMTHGFDNTGRKFNKYGNHLPWWSEKSVEMFNNKTQCFEEVFDDFMLPVLNHTVFSVNGKNTLGENLADDGGVSFSFRAYRNEMKRSGGELTLPGMQGYSHDQLFFMAYANMWCSEYSAGALVEALDDEHSPEFVRVLVTLQNSRDFSRAWNCPSGSYMNPEKKCTLWS